MQYGVAFSGPDEQTIIAIGVPQSFQDPERFPYTAVIGTDDPRYYAYYRDNPLMRNFMLPPDGWTGE